MASCNICSINTVLKYSQLGFVILLIFFHTSYVSPLNNGVDKYSEGALAPLPVHLATM